MDFKLFKSIMPMVIISVIVWIVGEIVIIVVMKLGNIASIVWSVIMLGVIISLSMWKSFKSDDDKNSRNW